MESHHKREKLFEEKYCKLINVKPYNDDIGIADNIRNPLNNFKVYLMRKDLTEHTIQEMGYISIIINYL